MTTTVETKADKPKDEKPKNFPLRQVTGTAAFHLSKEAVGFGYEDIIRMSPLDVVMFFAEARWGSTEEMPCPHCCTLAKHYWSAARMRWKCTCCGKCFLVTTNTVFAEHKLSLLKILGILFSWANGASGKPALQLRRDWDVSYSAVLTLLHRVREGLLRGFNTGVLCGIQEMDAMDLNGKRYKEKRNKPQGGRSAGTPKVPDELLKKPDSAADANATEGVGAPSTDADANASATPPVIQGPPTPPKFGKTAKQPPDRRLLLVLRQRSVSKGKGGCATRVCVALSESSSTVTAMAKKYASAESVIMTDEDPSYAKFKKFFAGHQTVSHSETYSLPDGTNNNQAESFNRRMRRGADGIYLNISTKYLADYAAEQAWREDVRKLSTGQKIRHLLRVAMGVGPSHWWCGYTHGEHRKDELLIEGDREAAVLGRKKGQKRKLPR